MNLKNNLVCPIKNVIKLSKGLQKTVWLKLEKMGYWLIRYRLVNQTDRGSFSKVFLQGIKLFTKL